MLFPFLLRALLVALTILSTPVLALAPVVVNEETSRLDLGQHLQYLEDPEGAISLAGLRSAGHQHAWQQADQSVLSFGYSGSSYWIRFPVHARTSKPLRLLVEIGHPLLSNIQAYVFLDGTLQTSHSFGASLPFSLRPILHPSFLLPLDMPANATGEVVLRVSSTAAIQLPVTLWSPEAFIAHDYDTVLSHGLLFGALLAIAIVNLLLFVTLRETAFFHFAMLELMLLMILAGLQGASFALLWPFAPVLNEIGLLVALSASVFFACWYHLNVLQLKSTRPRIARTLRIISYAAVATVFLAIVFPYKVVIVPTLILCMTSALVNSFAHIARWQDGYPPARILLSGTILMAMAIAVSMMARMGWLSKNLVVDNVLHIASVGMGLLYSSALAYRLNMDRTLREQAEQDTSVAQRQVLKAQIRLNQDLDRMVRDRTDALEEANRKLVELSTTDSLTQLRNRRYFDQSLAMEYERAYRDKGPVSILLLDIDHFKRINDRYGHPFGDLCLIEGAKLIQAAASRPADTAARYGGEEFVLLLPNTTLEGAALVAEKVRSKFESQLFSDETTQVKLTVSVGVASRVPTQHESYGTLLRQADNALYRAKEQGRNRVVVAQNAIKEAKTDG